jgi:hypothetical protein
MMHIHSLGRAALYYPEGPALRSGETRSTFRQLHDRVAGVAAALSGYGFQRGDRLALLLPNEREYLELVYACSWLGVSAVPLSRPCQASPPRCRSGSETPPRDSFRPPRHVDAARPGVVATLARHFRQGLCARNRRFDRGAPRHRSRPFHCRDSARHVPGNDRSACDVPDTGFLQDRACPAGLEQARMARALRA